MNEIENYIEKLASGEHLTKDESTRTFQIILAGGATPPQIASVLTSMKLNKETVEEITGAVIAVRAKAEKISAPENAIDTCGTGGDNSGSLNISTAVAFVVAGAGVPVAKHGNRSVSSRSGSADVLKELNVKTDIKKETALKCLEEAGMCFLLAPKYHAGFRHAGPVRQELGFRTIFNIIGPLANPAQVKHQLVGVYSKDLLKPIAEVLKNLGLKSFWVVNSEDGFDEISISAKTDVIEFDGESFKEFKVSPEEVGLPISDKSEIEGGEAAYNAERLKKLLNGQEDPYKDMVVLNAAAALKIAGKAKTLQEGVALANESIISGKAKNVLSQLIEITNHEDYAE